MKKKLLIGSLLAAFMLVTLPGVSAVENVKVETIRNTPVSKGAISSLIVQVAQFLENLTANILSNITTFVDPVQNTLESLIEQFWGIVIGLAGSAVDLLKQIL